MVKKQKSCDQLIGNGFRSIDVFGKPFSLTIRGQESFTSSLGGVITILYYSAILAYFIYQAKIMADKTNSKVTSTFQLRGDNYTDPEFFQLNKLGFDIAISIQEGLNDSFGQLKVSKLIQERNIENTSDQNMQVNEETIEIEKCGLNSLNYSNQEEIISKGIDKFYCIKNKTDLRIRGHYFSKYYESIIVKVFPCVNSSQNGNICASVEQQKQFFAQNTINIVFVNNYFDFKNPNDPIKQYILEGNYYPFIYDTKIITDIYIQQGEAITYSSLIPFSKPEKYKFAQVKEEKYHLADKAFYDQQNSLVFLMVRIDNQYTVFEGSIYTLADLITDIGGFMNSMQLIGFFLMRFYINQWLSSYILSKLFFTYTKNQNANSSYQQALTKKLQFAIKTRKLDAQMSQQITKEILMHKQFKYDLPDFIS